LWRSFFLERSSFFRRSFFHGRSSFIVHRSSFLRRVIVRVFIRGRLVGIFLVGNFLGEVWIVCLLVLFWFILFWFVLFWFVLFKFVLCGLVRCRSWVVGRIVAGWETKWSTKGSKFVGLNGVVVIGGEIVNGEEIWECVIAVVFIVVDGLVGAVFDNEAGGLKEGLAFVLSECLDAGNGRVGDGDKRPLVTGNAG
jgi:hypothetical protein